MRRAIVFGVIAAALVCTTGAAAKTYKVNRTGDGPVGLCNSAGCTLREAVSAANTHGSGIDVIKLRGGKTYKLTQGELSIDDRLRVESKNRKLAKIDANHTSRIFKANLSLTLKRIWVTRGLGAGERGGAISAEDTGKLTLRRSRVTASKTTGGNSGGGIVIYGAARIDRSTISGNRSSDDGGGISLIDGGTLRITNSTISGNRAPNGSGGGIDLINGASKLVLVNSTIAENKSRYSGGGILSYDAIAEISNSTIVRNASAEPGYEGGGLTQINGGTASVANSVIALNHADTIPDCYANVPVTGLGKNLFSAPPSGCSGLLGSSALVQQHPHLGVLTNNGGPTKTVALRRHSKAINNAGAGATKRDQRGHKRHNPDIGAFERS